METIVLYLGWATLLGLVIAACGCAWYWAVYWTLKSIAATATTTKLVRIYTVSLYRKRRRQKQKALNNLMSQTKQI